MDSIVDMVQCTVALHNFRIVTGSSTEIDDDASELSHQFEHVIDEFPEELAYSGSFVRDQLKILVHNYNY